MDLKNQSFHDSTITNINYTSECLIIFLEDVKNMKNSGLLVDISGCIHIEGLLNIETEDERLEELMRQYEFGDVLKLTVDKNTLELLVEWNRFNPHELLTTYHVIKGDKIFWK